ncbi:hypothetical protein BC830DRAFT_868487 [Chytriomyces sp. MP71]|nr:hypothetical protein BC830DRAFT_868487 [Chytriomyces sp. MP71]
MYNHNRPAAKGKGGKADNTPSVFGFFKRQESPIASICASGGSATREREAAHARALLAGGWKAASPSVHTVNAVNAASVNSSMSVANKLNSSSSSLAALASSVNLSNMVKHPKAPPKRTLPPSFDVFVPPPKRPSASVSQTSVKLGSQTTQNYPHSVSVSDSSSQLRGFQQNDPFADLDDDQLFGVPATVPSQSNPTTHHSYTSNYNPAASWSSNNVGNSYLKKSTDEFM